MSEDYGELGDFSEFDEPQPDDEFEGEYTVGEQHYNVTIKGMPPEGASKTGYYIAAYADGSHRTIDYLTGGIGWIERESGEAREHAKAIGKLIVNHFSGTQS